MHQTPSQAIGREGERWFVAALPPTWLFQRPSEDVGVDGVVIITDDGELRGAEFRVQIKSSQAWSIHEGIVTLKGIPRQTVRYWTFGLTPTLLVIYDQRQKIGWGAFLFDIVKDPLTIISQETKTFVLHVPTSMQITPKSWPTIKARLRSFYMDCLGAIHKAGHLLGTAHTLSQCLRGLQTAQFTKLTSDTHAEMALGLLQILCHRDAVRSLTDLREQLCPGSFPARNVEAAITRYRVELEKFVHDFDHVLATAGKETIGVWTNKQIMDERRPIMISLLTEFIVFLTGDYAGDAQRPDS